MTTEGILKLIKYVYNSVDIIKTLKQILNTLKRVFLIFLKIKSKNIFSYVFSHLCSSQFRRIETWRKHQWISACLRSLVLAPESKNLTLQQFKGIQGHRSWCQSKAHVRPVSYTHLTLPTILRV